MCIIMMYQECEYAWDEKMLSLCEALYTGVLGGNP